MASGMSATCVLTYQTMSMTQIKTEKQMHATTTLTAMGTKTPWAASLAMPARETTTARFMSIATKRTSTGTAWETSVTTAPKIGIQIRQIPMRTGLATSATGVVMVTAMESLTAKTTVVTSPTTTSLTMTTTIREMSAMTMTTMTGSLMTTTTASLSITLARKIATITSSGMPVKTTTMGTERRTFRTIALDPHGTSQSDPKWELRNKGAEIVQTLNSDPGLAIGPDKIEGVDFEGTFFVNTYSDDDYVGFVFSFQDNSKFYVVMWKKSRQTYWERSPFTAIAKAGIQLKLVDSKEGPGQWLRNAMWHTGHTKDHVKLIWQDKSQSGWQSKVAYRWLLIHRPKIGLIRLRIFKGRQVVADSGNQFDNTLKGGGRLGVFCFSQEQLIWSDQ